MSKPKISIIMPVYKVEQYLERAIKSILDQTFCNWELFLVDDGSPDASGEICDRFAAGDERICVIHQENGGAAAARNAAIEKAAGDYFYFMDSDDWCERAMLSEMYAMAKNNKADYVVCGYYIDTFYGDGPGDFVRLVMAPDEERVYKTAADFRADVHKYFDKNLLYTPWNKLYKAKYIRKYNIRFQDTQWDDFPFNLDFIGHAERVVVSPKKFYHFLRARSESESEKYIPRLYEKREEEHGWMLALYRGWNETTNPGILHDPEVKEFLSRRYIERLIGCFENLTNPRAFDATYAQLCDSIYGAFSHGRELPRPGGMRRLLFKLKWDLGVLDSMKVMLDNPRVEKTMKYARPRSFYTKLALLPVKYRLVPALYLQTRLISFVKTHFVRLFALLKARR